VGHQVAVWTFDKKTHALVGFAKGEVAPGGRAVLESVKGHAITFTLGQVKKEEVSDEPGGRRRLEPMVEFKMAHGTGSSQGSLALDEPKFSVEYGLGEPVASVVAMIPVGSLPAKAAAAIPTRLNAPGQPEELDDVLLGSASVGLLSVREAVEVYGVAGRTTRPRQWRQIMADKDADIATVGAAVLARMGDDAGTRRFCKLCLESRGNEQVWLVEHIPQMPPSAAMLDAMVQLITADRTYMEWWGPNVGVSDMDRRIGLLESLFAKYTPGQVKPYAPRLIAWANGRKDAALPRKIEQFVNAPVPATGPAGSGAGTQPADTAKLGIAENKWQAQLVSNIRGEAIGDCIANLGNFDDQHLADTSLNGIRAESTAGQSIVVTRLARVRRLLEEGRRRPDTVIGPFRSAFKRALDQWPQARQEFITAFTQAEAKGVGFARGEPMAYDKIKTLSLAATYVLAELGDHESLPLMVRAFEMNIDPKQMVSPAEPAVTLFAMHQLILSYPEAKLTPQSRRIRDEYLAATKGVFPEPEKVIVTRWQADYSESDPRVVLLDLGKKVLRDQPTMEMRIYPVKFADAQRMTESMSRPTERTMKLFEQIKQFVQLSFSAGDPEMLPPAIEGAGTQPAGSKLEFRIAPSASSLTNAERDSYMDWLKAGKVGFWWKAGRIRGRMPDHAWLAFAGDMANAGNLVTGEYKGQKYVLVSDKPGQTMVTGDGKHAWGLTMVRATTDAMNRLAVGFDLDDRGAELFSAFTKANIGNVVAIVVDGKVVSVPVIRAALGKRGMILGRFSEQEVQAFVKALKAGMPPTTQPAPNGAGTQPAGKSPVEQVFLTGVTGWPESRVWFDLDSDKFIGGMGPEKPAIRGADLHLKSQADVVALNMTIAVALFPDGIEDPRIEESDSWIGNASNFLARANPMGEQAIKPKTAYFFRTADGSVGALRIAEEVKKYGVIIKYRVVQPAYPWGRAAGGLQARLCPDKRRWDAGQTPTFRADIRYSGTAERRVAQSQELCELELDGNTYRWAGDIAVKRSALPPGRLFDDISVRLEKSWHLARPRVLGRSEGFQNDAALTLGPGKHTLRVRFFPESVGGGARNVSVETNTVEFEILQAPASPAATQSAGKAGAVRGLKQGDAAPDFTAKTLDGKEIRLSDYQGKFVLLEFWATWCGACVREAPYLKAVHDAFGRNERFVMVGLSLDEDIESPGKFVKEAGLGWVQGFLGAWRKTDIPDKYGVRGIPGIFLVGPDGKIVTTGIRGRNLKIVVAKALGEPIPQPTLTDDERIRLEQAKSMVDLCRAQLNRSQEAAKHQGASENDVAQAGLALKRAELALQVVQCHTRDDQAGINRIQEEAAQLALEVARVYLKSIQEAWKEGTRDKLAVDRARLLVKLEELRVKRAECQTRNDQEGSNRAQTEAGKVQVELMKLEQTALEEPRPSTQPATAPAPSASPGQATNGASTQPAAAVQPSAWPGDIAKAGGLTINALSPPEKWFWQEEGPPQKKTWQKALEEVEEYRKTPGPRDRVTFLRHYQAVLDANPPKEVMAEARLEMGGALVIAFEPYMGPEAARWYAQTLKLVDGLDNHRSKMVTKIHFGEILNKTYPHQYDKEIDRLFREVLTVLPEQVVFDHESMRHLNVDAIEAAVDPQLNGPNPGLPDLPQTRSFRQQVNDAYRQQLRKARAEYVTGLRRSAAESWLQAQHVYGSPEETWRRRAAIGKEFSNDAQVQAALNALMPSDAERSPAEASGTASTQPAARKGVGVTGRVLDKPGGKGVGGITVALVSLDDGAKRSAVTDGEGKYFFEDVRYVGMLHLVQIGEHGPGVWTDDGRADVPKVGPATTGTAVIATDIYSKTPCTISGAVIDADTGKGIAGVEILVSTADRNRTRVHTDKHGKYRLHVIPRNVQIDCDGTDDRYLPPEKDRSRTITVKAGDDVKDVNFTVRSAPKYTGRVLMPDGTPAANTPVLAVVRWSDSSPEERKRIAEARVRREERIKAGKEAAPAAKPSKRENSPLGRASEAGWTSGFRLRTDGEGRFEVYSCRDPFICPDRDDAVDILILARSADRMFGGVKVLETTTIDPPPDPMEVKLARVGTAGFKVVNPDMAPIAQAKPNVRSSTFRSKDVAFWDPNLAPEFAEFGDGRYAAAGLIPGMKYRLSATAEGYKCRTDFEVMAKPGETVDAGTLTLDWWGPKAVPGLIEKLKDNNAGARISAACDLGLLGPVAVPAVEALVEAFVDDQNKSVQLSAAAALTNLGPAAIQAIPALTGAIEHGNPDIACAAIDALGKIGPAAKSAVPDLIGVLQGDSQPVIYSAITALSRLGDARAIPHIKPALVNADQSIRQAAAAALDNAAFVAADPNIPAMLKLARTRKGYQGADLIMLALGPTANLRIARMVQEVSSRQAASETTKHILGILIGRPYESDTEGNVTPRTVLAWWWQFPLADSVPPRATLDLAAMEALWGQLACEDIVQGRQAMLKLASGGEEAVAFLAGKLHPPAVGDREIAAMIARLGDEKSAVREQATAQLALAGRSAEAAMKAALAAKSSAEVRTRLALLLDALSQPYPAMPSTRQAARGLRVLEMIGTPPALKVLADLAKGNGEEFLCVQARQRAAFRARSGEAVGAGTPRIGASPAVAPAPNKASMQQATRPAPSAGSGQASDRGATRPGDSGKP
jgi:peroxiredoxin